MPTLLLIIGLAAAGPQFEVQTLGGESIAGQIVGLDMEGITVGGAGGPVSLKTGQLLVVSRQAPPPPSAHEPEVQVRLVDGSLLAAGGVTIADGLARITLADGEIAELPTAGIAAVRLQPQSESVAAEWSRILEMKADSDLLVVRNGQTLDYHKGVLHDVSDTVVGFEFDGQVLPVKRSKVHGLVYYRPPGATLPEAICRITDAGGSQWSVRGLALAEELEWTTPGGLTVSRPLAMITRIDFSSGKVVYLGDLRPESVEVTPYFGRSDAGSVLADFRAPRTDTNLSSGPLRLGGIQYAKGLAVHSRTRLVYRLPGQFRRFQAVVGIDDAVRPHGHVRLTIHGDDKLLLETTATGSGPPEPVDLDLTGVRRLVILVDYGEKLDVGDHLDLGNARIIK